MKQITMPWGNLPPQSITPDDDGHVRIVFTPPNPLSDSAKRNGLIAVRQRGGPSASFEAVYQGRPKDGNQSNGASYGFRANPPAPGVENVVDVYVTGNVEAIVAELKVGAVHEAPRKGH